MTIHTEALNFWPLGWARSTSLLFTLFCSVAAFGQVTVSNLAEGGSGFGSYSNISASSFSTDSTVFPLSSVTILRNGGSTPDGSYSLAIYSDNVGTVGSLLETLSGNSAPGNGYHTYTSSGLALSANTTYWVVSSSNTLALDLTTSAGQSSTGASWLIGDSYYQGSSLGSLTLLGGYSLRLSVTAGASAIPEPSTYAALFGACALGLVVYLRNRTKQAA